MPLEEAVRARAVERERGAAPAPAPAVRTIRPSRPAAGNGEGFGRGFRTGLLLSLAAHALVGALFARDLLSGKPPGQRPVLVSTGLEARPLLDPDPEPLEVKPPEVVPPRVPTPELREDLPDPVDPRVAESPEPPGPPPGVIGVQAPDGRRRGVPGGRGRGGGGGGGRTDRAPPLPADGIPLPEVPPPPAREPAFVAARLRVDAIPVYPARSLERGVEGSVYLRIEVSPEGKVVGVAVETSSGTPALDAAAVRAAGGWLFDPATEDGRPVSSTVYRMVRFHL
jgi:protein TonB